MERRDDETVKRGRVRHRANLNSCFETHGVGKSTGGEDGVHELPYRPAALAIATPIGIGVERFHSVKRAKVSLCLSLFSVCLGRVHNVSIYVHSTYIDGNKIE